jgi:hypothetical protein
VQEKPAQELYSIEGHDALAIAVGAISVAEGDRLVVDAEDAPIADSNPVGVTGQILEHQL